MVVASESFGFGFGLSSRAAVQLTTTRRESKSGEERRKLRENIGIGRSLPLRLQEVQRIEGLKRVLYPKRRSSPNGLSPVTKHDRGTTKGSRCLDGPYDLRRST